MVTITSSVMAKSSNFVVGLSGFSYVYLGEDPFPSPLERYLKMESFCFINALRARIAL